ncbi:MAG: hypothetical protein JWL64_166 [Frankiales bacterium]|nr:hypothetical protein [Frankiales bacterium]
MEDEGEPLPVDSPQPAAGVAAPAPEMSTMRKRPSPHGPRLGFLERIMFSFMGPPDVGDVNAPAGVDSDPAAALCRKCGQPWERHGRVHTGSMTYRPCPADQDRADQD